MHFGLLSFDDNLPINKFASSLQNQGLFRKFSPWKKFRIFIFIVYMATQMTKFTPKLDQFIV